MGTRRNTCVRWSAWLTLVIALATVAAAATPAARAGGAFRGVPADGTFEFQGRGYGHGRGVSQWGAQGAALRGKSVDQILDFYYPGTSSKRLAGRPIRVYIMEDEGQDVRVSAQRGLKLLDRRTGKRYLLRGMAQEWRIRRDGADLIVEARRGGTWRRWQPRGGATRFGGPLAFSAPANLRLLFDDGSWREYRGSLEAVPAASGLLTVNQLRLERYLYAVVSREMDMGFAPVALQVEAVVARTYALYLADHADTRPAYDVCSNSWRCISYSGVRYGDASGYTRDFEHPNGIAAVHATRGVVRVLDGAPIYAEASASNGGMTRAWDNWPPRPYLRAAQDDWDGEASPHGSWTASVSASSIEARYPAVGHLLGVEVVERDGIGAWGGRVTAVRITGDAGSVTVSGDEFRWVSAYPDNPAGLRSAWWTIT